jgi:hypothetical protein
VRNYLKNKHDGGNVVFFSFKLRSTRDWCENRTWERAMNYKEPPICCPLRNSFGLFSRDKSHQYLFFCTWDIRCHWVEFPGTVLSGKSWHICFHPCMVNSCLVPHTVRHMHVNRFDGILAAVVKCSKVEHCVTLFMALKTFLSSSILNIQITTLKKVS